MGMPYACFNNWNETTKYLKNKSYTVRLQYLFRLIIGAFKVFAEFLTSLDKYDGTGISSIGDSAYSDRLINACRGCGIYVAVETGG
jgi:hypothetical protein